MGMLIGVGVGEGGDRSGFLSKRSIWVINDDMRLILRCGLVVLEDEYERRVGRYVLGMGLVVGEGLNLGHW